MKQSFPLGILFCAWSAAPPAMADMAPPEGVVSLSASASVEVTKDLLRVTMTATREGADAAAIQSDLKQALDAALAQAKRAVRPGQLEVQTGNFSLYPRYSNKGVLIGWQGSTELAIEGRDLPAIGQLTGRITTMTIGRVSQNLSREAREQAEGEVSSEAIARFRAKAADYSRQFGFAGYVVREVNVNGTEPVSYGAAPQMMRSKAAGAADEALVVEPGKATVTVNVNGSVQMK